MGQPRHRTYMGSGVHPGVPGPSVTLLPGTNATWITRTRVPSNLEIVGPVVVTHVHIIGTLEGTFKSLKFSSKREWSVKCEGKEEIDNYEVDDWKTVYST